MEQETDPLGLILQIEIERKKFLDEILKRYGLSVTGYYRLRHEVANGLPEDFHVELDKYVANIVITQKRVIPEKSPVVFREKRLVINKSK